MNGDKHSQLESKAQVDGKNVWLCLCDAARSLFVKGLQSHHWGLAGPGLPPMVEQVRCSRKVLNVTPFIIKIIKVMTISLEHNIEHLSGVEIHSRRYPHSISRQLYSILEKHSVVASLQICIS